MIWFVLRKLAGFAATMLATAAILYWLLAMVPQSSARSGDFFSWLGHMLLGDFGASAAGGVVGSQIAARLAVTIPLALMAILIAALIGFGLGLLAAFRPDSIGDRALGALGEVAVATPNFWVGMVLVLALARGLHWLPPGGFVPWQDNFGAALASLLLPALALAVPPAGALALKVHASLTKAGTSTHVLAGRARGLTEREAMMRHGWRPALLTLATPLGLLFAAILAGTVIVENVFYLPGLGRLILDAVAGRDVVTVRAALVILMLLISGTIFLLDLCIGWIDPRIGAEVPE